MKNVKRIAAVAITIAVLIISLTEVSYFHRVYTRLMDFYGYENDSMDMVVVGTSVTFSTYIPMQMWEKYGIASCNYCTNVMFQNSIRYSIRDVLKTQSPKLIMVDISPFVTDSYAGNPQWSEEWKKQFVNYNIDSRRYSLDRLRLITEINEDLGGNWLDGVTYWFDIYRYHNDKPVINEYRIKNASEDNIDRGYGYLNRMGGEILEESMIIKEADKSINYEEDLFSGRSLKYLNDLIDEVKKINADTDTQIIFYSAPILYIEEINLARRDYVIDSLRENGIDCYDLSARASEFIIDEDFWGHDHFDYLGAVKATDILYEDIIRNYELPDRRGDEKYSYWNDDYDRWTEHKFAYEGEDSYRIEQNLIM